MNSGIYRAYTGRDNYNVIENLKMLVELADKNKIICRVPHIPNYNTPDDVNFSINQLKKIGVVKIEEFEAAIDEKVLREDKYKLPDGKYFMIVLIFIMNSEGKFLMQKTSKSRNSCIATTGGHVSYGDTGLITVFKEAKEELGLDLDTYEIQYIDTLIFKNGIEETYFVNKDIDINTLTIQKEEVDYVEWFTVDEIKELINKKEFREGNIDAFYKVLDYIQKKIG